MSREPLFMQDLHRRQSKEYELTKRLTLQQFVEYINNKVKKRKYLKKDAENRSY
ncbi:MAG: hypothetical protein KKC11_03660 [Candidatus Omnitrophica bacterium]|nr:hypothetical protein [Candidatus Omnitrophota bacterium]MBU0878208.1 hypothetical protein [Candidatus Omnitrophota bacterium]MBU1134060.1 hypothetical protein [Candidatus Omnitrophota bacterium]MBU1366737.1 hypothetical protein [Candidatus Omnitrophota bacterium]MBU1524740.1 hypothetical protein [Candidatus Omnitrophota bacterium]